MTHELAARSTDAIDYQFVPRPVAAMAKRFDDGHRIDPHQHERDQFLYAVSGLMRLQSELESWIVPPDRAVYIPAGTRHSVEMCGDVEMRTLYITPHIDDRPSPELAVVEVPDLLRALILALVDEPVLYEENGRGGVIARLLVIEIRRARELSFCLPLPNDARLQKICTSILADPADRRTLDGWSETAGASTRTLARLFEREVGMGFGAWRQRVRFHAALEDLSRGEPIARVAHRHGYQSASAFSAAFARTMGLTPSAARQR